MITFLNRPPRMRKTLCASLTFRRQRAARRLRQELAGAHDRPCDQFWKVGDEHGVLPPASADRNLPAVNVNYVTEGFECIERNANGQKNRQGDERPVRQRGGRTQKKLCVLEIRKQAEIRNQTE